MILLWMDTKMGLMDLLKGHKKIIRFVDSSEEAGDLLKELNQEAIDKNYKSWEIRVYFEKKNDYGRIKGYIEMKID